MLKRETKVTLYNAFYSKAGDVEYNRTVLFVHYENVRGDAVSKTANISMNACSLFIPFKVETESGKQYISHEEYEKLDNRSDFFTFRKGDILVKGELTQGITSEKEFILEHPEAVRIHDWETNAFGSQSMRHWEVHCD